MTEQVVNIWNYKDIDIQASMWCPGCDSLHVIPIYGEYKWDWNGARDTPTFSPSILVYNVPPHQPRCHSFIREGKWEYLSDCEHKLAGQVVDMVPLKEWLYN